APPMPAPAHPSTRLRDLRPPERTPEINRRYMDSRYLNSTWSSDEYDFIIGHLLSELENAQQRAQLVQGEVVELEGAAGISCLGCLIERHQGQREQPNPAATIVGGQATCLEHLKLV